MSGNRDDALLWDNFAKLGEMIGDGLHLEADGKWITKEYDRLAKILMEENPYPELERKAARRLNNLTIDKQMAKLLSVKKCECGGIIKQSRSGSKVAYCQSCGMRYRAQPKKSSCS